MVYLLYFVFVCSEYICLVLLGICAFPLVFLGEITSLSFAFIFLAIYSSVKKENYSLKAALIIAFGSFTVSLTLFGIFMDTT
mmetsp:Transcript_6402/g.817  ORF Transcript_6402/g.817 Transcript_6402/m.817 type:complete len:82 (+) Transcript_6402:78-323(+)